MRFKPHGRLLLLALLAVGVPIACGDPTIPPTGTGGSPGTGGEGGIDGTGGKGTTGTGGGMPDGGPAVVEWPTVKSEIPLDPEIETAVKALLATMTVEQKVGQMVQPEIQAVTPAEVKQYHLGSILNGGGSWPNNSKDAKAQDWVTLADAYYTASTDTTGGAPGEFLGIPVLWGTDAVHGHGNVKGATLFPHNIGLGAAHDPDLIEKIGAVTSAEIAVTGIDWTFAPSLAVVRDDRWGRTYEGYSEDPEIIKAYAGRMVSGLQGKASDSASLLSDAHVICTAKHFLGDGGTDLGKDQGNNISTEQQLIDLHAQGYLTAIAAGAQTVMASFSSWQDQKMHGNHYLLTDILKGKFGFDGFVIGDWNGHAQVPGCSNDHCPAAINAGVDMIMVPNDWKAFIANTIDDVKKNDITAARLDDAVTRILRVKMRAGLLGPKKTKGAPSTRMLANQAALLGSPDHRAVAREAVRKSIVLLKNKAKVLPLAKSLNVLVAGKGADSIPNQSGGWSLTWQGTGTENADFPGATSVFAGINGALSLAGKGGAATLSADGSLAAPIFNVVIVVIGETPYAEGQGDITKVQTMEHALLHPEDLEVINTIRTKAPLVPIITVLLSGRPLFVNKELNRSDGFVAAFLPGTEGGGIADVLFGDNDFSGKLSFSWPGADCQTPLNRGGTDTALFPYGFGLTYQDTDTLADTLSELSTGHGCAVTDPGMAGTTDEVLSIFTGGKNQGDFVLRIGGPSNWGGIDVGTAATLPGSEVAVVTIDGKIQQSARLATWTGTGQIYSQVTLGMPGIDLSKYGNSETSVAFRVRVDAAPQGLVNLSAHCVYPCEGSIPFTSALTSVADGQWHDMSVPLKCLVDAGLDLTNVNSPFLLYSEVPMMVALEDIRWEPWTAGKTPDCSVLPLAKTSSPRR